MASPTYADVNSHHQSQPSTPSAQHQPLPQTPNAQSSQQATQQDPHSLQHHHQLTPADMLATTAQMPPPFHPAAFPPGTVPVAYFASPTGGIIAIPQIKTKRRQVKNACTNCQKACKKCDEARPCTRCQKYGIAKDCVDSQRKERKKGVKRGPYKKRDQRGQQEEGEGSMAAQMADTSYQSMQIPSGMAFYGYGPNGAPIFAQIPKGPDGTYSYPQYYMPPPVEGDPAAPGTPGLAAYPPYYGHMMAPPYGGQQYGQHYMVPTAGPSGSGQPSQEHSGTPSGGVPGNESPVFGLSPAMPSASHHDHDDSPIERPSAPLAYPNLAEAMSPTPAALSVQDSPAAKSGASPGKPSSKSAGKQKKKIEGTVTTMAPSQSLTRGTD